MGIAALAVGGVFAVGTYLAEQGRFEAEIVDFARVQVAGFAHQSRDVLDAPVLDSAALQSALGEFSAAMGGVTRSDGRFVVAAIYDTAGNVVARITDAEYPHLAAVEEILATIQHTLPERERDWISAKIAGAPHVGVVMPLRNSAGDNLGHIEGVFAVSAQGMAAIRSSVTRAVVSVVGVVLLTTILIYPVISSLIGRIARTTSNLLDSNLDTLQVLGSAIAKRDSDTDAHNYRVTVYAVRLAEAIGLPRAQMRGLIKGALLHDVGKIGIRDDVLLKPGRLSEYEFNVMKTHVRHGLDITSRSSWLEDAHNVVSSHHERIDGAGYPRGLRGEEIPVSARIFAIADVFDALTSKRPYKEAFSFTETIVILDEGRGSQFDTDMLDAFLEIARGLYDEFAGLENDRPREELHSITDQYFAKNARELFA